MAQKLQGEGNGFKERLSTVKKKKCLDDNLPGFCNRFGRRLGDIFETSIKCNLKKNTVLPSPLFLGCHSKNCGSGSYFWLQSSNSHCFCSFCFTSLLVENLLCHIYRSSTVSFLLRCSDEKLPSCHLSFCVSTRHILVQFEAAAQS